MLLTWWEEAEEERQCVFPTARLGMVVMTMQTRDISTIPQDSAHMQGSRWNHNKSTGAESVSHSVLLIIRGLACCDAAML